MDSPCASCGAATSGARSLELALPAREQSPRRPRRRDDAVGAAIELAFDPRSARSATALAAAPSAAQAAPTRNAPSSRPLREESIGLVSDAKLLADHGDPPERWIASAVYAWRVLRRRRELRRALVTRREEAKRAALEHEDALVTFAEQARTTVERRPAYVDEIERLRRAEETLASRRKALAAQNDADSLRLASIDARLAKLESERDHAANEERTAAAELAAAQAALEREEALLKRAEAEARAALQRERTGG